MSINLTTDRRQRTAELFREAELTSSPDRQREIRNQVTMVNAGVAQALAHRYRGRSEPDDDLEQVAYVGLVKAAEGFDPKRGKDFLSYAVPTISGELKRHFRDHCWWVRPPRRVQELQARIAGCTDKLTQDLGRPPTPDEYAEELGIPVDDVSEALSADGCFTPSSLDAPTGPATGTVLADLIGEADPDLRRSEVHAMLAPLVRELPERDRQVIALRFYHDWTQEQIARSLGVTQTQVSRVLRRILQDLRSALVD